MKIIYYIILFFVSGIFLNLPVQAQELEPRSLTNLPVGTNFVVAGYGFASGNIMMDPSLPLENMDAKLNTFFGAYVRSFNFFGMSAKVDAVLPYATGDYNYQYQGVDEYDKSDGFGDARIRFSFNFIGAKALKSSDYKNFNQKTIVGYSIQLIMPTGNYNSGKVVNLGSNRWTFRNQIGISQKLKNWIIEGYVALWLFTANNNFLNGNKLSQKPLFCIKADIIRTLPKKFWIALGAGYGYGGRSYVNAVSREVLISTIRLGLTLAIPIAPQHSLKLVGVSGIRFQQGADFDAISLSYQFMWNRK